MGGVRFLILALGIGFVVASCGGSSTTYMPAPAPGYKVGKPYRINGKSYFPRHEPDYNRVGVASWYGDEFHGRRTANGEVFNMYAMTAAHPTLTLPAEVRVTNLENNRSAILRVNDRGPFKSDRIIDVSRAAAQKLGFLNKGTARVRVEYIGLADLHPSSRGRYASLESVSGTSIVTNALPVEPVSIDEIARDEAEDFRPAVRAGSSAMENLRPAIKPSIAPSQQSTITTSSIPSHASDQVLKTIPQPLTKPLMKPSIIPAKNAAGQSIQWAHLEAADGPLFVTDVYLDALEAELARQKLSAMGKVQMESKSDTNLGDYFVIKVGPFEDLTEAQQAVAHLRAQGHSGAIITIE